MSLPPMRTQVESYIRQLQSQIVSSLESLDPNAPAFKRDGWLRPDNGGSGLSCVFAVPPPSSNLTSEPPKTVLEKAGVNISIVNGTLPPAAIKQMRADHSTLPESPETGLPFFAAGISLVIHPRNPHCPTVHANYRYFEVSKEEGEVIAWWFGGGSDLTPSYLYEEDVKHFHQTLLDAAPSPLLYSQMKKWCDIYFHIPHRSESRGVGGIFYDDISLETPPPTAHLTADALPKSEKEIFGMMRSFGDAFIPSYLPILEKRKDMEWTARQRRWQLIRRGRYVEFNLVYDRGTKFGLMTPNARIESILMSLPEEARWEYMSEMGEEEGSEEKKLVEVLRKPRNWV